MITSTSILPETSDLAASTEVFDYVDCYGADFVEGDAGTTILDVAKSFFKSAPSWVGVLMVLRDKLVGLIGLKTSGSAKDAAQKLNSFTGALGTQLGIFTVFATSQDEVILGEDDQHLDFRVSLLLSDIDRTKQIRNLKIITAVTFNNWVGRLYFMPVRPFHKLIVRAMLKNMLKDLQK